MSNYDKLRNLIEEINVLLSQSVTTDNSDFRKWYIKTERFLSLCFGEDSNEHKDFKETSFSPLLYWGGETDQQRMSEQVESCRSALIATKDTLTVYLEEMEEELNMNALDNNQINYDMNKVFIVHGHDDAIKQEMARFLEKIKLEPIILHEQANQWFTIIEKIEEYSNVGFAIVLYTGCDIGRDKDDSRAKEKYRARQNVVFEHGYLIGKLGRNKVCAFVKGEVETPGDISGVLYIPFDKAEGWKQDLVKNMKAVGYDIDANLIF